MDIIDALSTASKQLRDLFKDKSELRGFGDWDVFLGCIMLIDNAVAQLQEAPQEETTEE